MPPSEVQDLRQDNLGGLWPPRRPGDERRPGIPALCGSRAGGWRQAVTPQPAARPALTLDSGGPPAGRPLMPYWGPVGTPAQDGDRPCRPGRGTGVRFPTPSGAGEPAGPKPRETGWAGAGASHLHNGPADHRFWVQIFLLGVAGGARTPDRAPTWTNRAQKAATTATRCSGRRPRLAPPAQTRRRQAAEGHPAKNCSLWSQSCAASSGVATGLGGRTVQLSK